MTKMTVGVLSPYDEDIDELETLEERELRENDEQDNFDGFDDYTSELNLELQQIDTSPADNQAAEDNEFLAAAALDAACYERDPAKLQQMFSDINALDAMRAEEAGKQVVQQLEKWILCIGHKHFPTWMKNDQEKEELVQAAWVAVFASANKYNPHKAAPSTFFYRPIMHEMSDYINRFLKKSTGYNTSIQRQIKQAIANLRELGNRSPTILDIAYEAGLKPSIVRKSMEFTGAAETRSLDEMTFDPSEYSATGKSGRARDDYEVSAAAYAEQYNPYVQLVKREESKALTAALDELPITQKDIICRLFGIGCEKQTYLEIFRETGITTNDIKAIEAQAKSRLKMNSNLRNAWKGKASEIKEELNFEPLAITPDTVAFSMMDILAQCEDIEI